MGMRRIFPHTFFEQFRLILVQSEPVVEKMLKILNVENKKQGLKSENLKPCIKIIQKSLYSVVFLTC